MRQGHSLHHLSRHQETGLEQPHLTETDGLGCGAAENRLGLDYHRAFYTQFLKLFVICHKSPKFCIGSNLNTIN